MRGKSAPDVSRPALDAGTATRARMGRPRPPLVLATDSRQDLERLLRAPTTPQSLVLRIKIILYCAEGFADVLVARELGVVNGTIGKWRRRFAAGGVDGLNDRKRPGRPKRVRAKDGGSRPSNAGGSAPVGTQADGEPSPARVLRTVPRDRIAIAPVHRNDRRADDARLRRHAR